MLSSESRGVFGRRVGGMCLLAAGVWAMGPAPASAQCEQLLPGTGVPGLDGYPAGTANELLTWDPDGSGPLGPWLTAVGRIEVAERTAVKGVATWDGSAWRALTAVQSGFAYSEALYQDRLFVAGEFIADTGEAVTLLGWDGSAFTKVPGAPTGIRKLGAYNGELIAATTNSLRAWNGTTWRTITSVSRVLAMTEYNNELIIAGTFTSVAGTAAQRIAAWNGTTWRELGWGMPDEVNGLAVHQGSLYATGEFFSAGGAQAKHIARWNGTEWSIVGTGVGMTPFLTIGPEGYTMLSDGNDLYLGGSFGSMDGVATNGFARWDGTAWHAVPGIYASRVQALAKYGDEIAVGGFVRTDDLRPAHGLIFHGPTGWRTIPSEDGLAGSGRAAATWNDKLVVTGTLSWAGDVQVNNIAAWDGANWEALGAGLGSPPVGMTEYQGDLVVVGNFSSAGDAPASGVARWDGSAWSPMGSLKVGSSAYPTSCTVYNGELYAAGNLALPGAGIARWDGSAWNQLAGGLDGGVVRAMAEYNGELIVAGYVRLPGSSARSQVLAWNGTSWRIVGSVGPGRDPGPYPGAGVHVMCVYAGKLFAFGDFEGINGSGVYGAAAWDGTAWSAVTPATVPSYPYSATSAFVYGDRLYVGLNDVPSLVRWDGVTWSTAVGGLNHKVAGLTEFNGALVAVGEFTVAGGEVSAYWARITDACPCVVDLTGDGLVDFGDYLEFLNLFDVQDPRVDFTGDGLVDFGDYLEFLNLFEAGC